MFDRGLKPALGMTLKRRWWKVLQDPAERALQGAINDANQLQKGGGEPPENAIVNPISAPARFSMYI